MDIESNQTHIFPSRDRAERTFVWTLWAIMMIVAIVSLFAYTKNFPRDEDWFLIPALTGNEPNLARWLWAQQENSEHRVPFPRMILLMILKLTHGDFRAGGLVNILTLGTLAAAMMLAAKRIRNGCTRFTDAFFPLALLHLGHSENLFWGWQITQVLPTALACCILLVIVTGYPVITPASAALSGAALMLLPLNGGNGLLYVPPLALWFIFCGIQQWRETRRSPLREVDRGALTLITTGCAAIGLTGLYFVGFEQRSWYPPPSSLTLWLETAMKFLAMGLGPIARNSWALSVTATIACVLVTSALAFRGASLNRGAERRRAVGVFVFVTTIILFALALSWGRAEAISHMFGFWPIRYALFAVPMLCAGFFLSELYASTRFRFLFQTALLSIMAVSLPLNIAHGWDWTNWFLERHAVLEQDLASGISVNSLVDRHKAVLISWMEPGRVASLVHMLQEADYKPFAYLVEKATAAGTASTPGSIAQAKITPQPTVETSDRPLVTQELRYTMPEADEVFLVWGINGWQIAPELRRPVQTTVQNQIMHTPMVRDGQIFISKLTLPSGTSLDYCFLITKKRNSFRITWPLCDGDYRLIFAKNGTAETSARVSLALTSQEIRYTLPEAEEVYLVWGLNDWRVAPESLRPAGTIIKDDVMQSPMIRSGNTFITKLQVPVGTTATYGFRITKRRGLFDLVHPVWDGDYHTMATKDSVVEVNGSWTIAPRRP